MVGSKVRNASDSSFYQCLVVVRVAYMIGLLNRADRGRCLSAVLIVQSVQKVVLLLVNEKDKIKKSSTGRCGHPATPARASRRIARPAQSADRFRTRGLRNQRLARLIRRIISFSFFPVIH